MTCSKCQKELSIGEWPFCPHGEPGVYKEFGDECDYVDHNLGPEPIHIRSWSERRALMKQAGLADAPYYPREQGPSPTVDWAGAPDRQTMENVKELMERAFGQRSQEPSEESPVVNLDVHAMDKAEVKKYVH